MGRVGAEVIVVCENRYRCRPSQFIWCQLSRRIMEVNDQEVNHHHHSDFQDQRASSYVFDKNMNITLVKGII